MELAHFKQAKHNNGGVSAGASGCGRGRRHGLKGRGKEASSSSRQPVVIGGSILDLTAKIRSREIMVSEIV